MVRGSGLTGRSLGSRVLDSSQRLFWGVVGGERVCIRSRQPRRSTLNSSLNRCHCITELGKIVFLVRWLPFGESNAQKI